MNGCNFRFTAGETVKGSTTETTAGKTHLVCPAGNKIKVGPIGCTIEIGTQTFESGHIVYKQLGTFPSTVTAEVTLTGIEYKQVGAGCNGGEGSFFNGTYSGNITISGTDKNNNLTAFGVK